MLPGLCLGARHESRGTSLFEDAGFRDELTIVLGGDRGCRGVCGPSLFGYVGRVGAEARFLALPVRFALDDQVVASRGKTIDGGLSS